MTSIMKKVLFVLPVLALLVSCQPEPKPSLEPSGDDLVQVKLTKANCGLPIDNSESVEEITASLKVDGKEATYDVKIGAPCYLSNKANEFIIKPGAYIKSGSEYKVDKLIIDFFGKKGINFGVFANGDGTGEEIAYHESTVQPEDSSDGGMVYEYPINSTGWMIKNMTEFNKPGIYSVTIVFSL